jgi:predicted nucleic acid-binding protein
LAALQKSTVPPRLNSSEVRVLPQSRSSFLNGISLYEARPDKQYSLVDCISMTHMKSMGIKDVLTNDRHFSQEQFNKLM